MTGNVILDNAYLNPLESNFKGSVKNNGIGVPNMYIEFYNPLSVQSPNPDIRIVTDKNGNFDVTDTTHWVKFGDEFFYKGLSSNTTYTITCLSMPSTWPAKDPRNYPNSFAAKDLTLKTGEDGVYRIVFDNLQHITNINIFDRDQGETTFFDEFYRMVYRDGVPQAEPSLVGDSKMQIIGDFEISIIQDCILKVKYYVDSVEVVETYEPILVESSAG